VIPISDDNPVRARPFVNWVLILLCIATFFWQLSLPEEAFEDAIESFAFMPSQFFQSAFAENAMNLRFGLPSDAEAGVLLSLITSMFLHGGFLHLGGNMLYLWIFGNNVEDAMGHGRYLIFYLLCGIAAALTEGAMTPHSVIPMLGASGAISGVLGAYVLIYPRARVTVIIPLGILLYPMRISALYVTGFWFLIQLAAAAFSDPGSPGVAWWAHLGGFGAGLLMTPFLSKFPLLGRFRRSPWQ